MGQWPTIVLAMLAAALVAAAGMMLVPKRYYAVAEILIDPRGLQIVQNDVTPRSQNNELSIAVVESQLHVVTSERILRQVIDRLGLDKDTEFTDPGLLGRLSELFNTGKPRDPPQATALRNLIRHVEAKRPLRSFVIQVVASSKDPVKAAAIADAVADAYFETEVAARSTIAERAASAMSSRLKQLADRVLEAERQVEQFKASNNLVGTRGQFVTEQQLTELNNRLIAARGRVAEEEGRIEQIEALLQSNADPASIAEAVRSPVISALRSRFSQLASEEANLSALLGPRHPQIVAVRQELRKFRQLIAEELRRLIDAARGQADRAKATERALATELETLKGAAVQRDKAMIKLRELNREAESNRAVYESFLVRSRELEEQRGVDTTNTRIIAEAIVPKRPSGLAPIVVLVAALAAGLALGLALAVLRISERPAAPPLSRGFRA